MVLQFYNELSKYILLFINPDLDPHGFLKLMIHALYKFWEIFSHYLFRYCLCSILSVLFSQNSIYKYFTYFFLAPFLLIFYINIKDIFIYFIYYRWYISYICIIYSFLHSSLLIFLQCIICYLTINWVSIFNYHIFQLNSILKNVPGHFDSLLLLFLFVNSIYNTLSSLFKHCLGLFRLL